jgi:AhpD family alkylhydroperoxidase
MSKIPVKQYHKMSARHPELLAAVESLGTAAGAAGPLDETVRQLIQLGAAAAIHSEGAVHSHTRRALESGATADEIRHALLLLTSTIGFPAVVAAMTWADDVLESEDAKA